MKLKWSKRIKFWPIHFYRIPRVGLKSLDLDLDNLFEKNYFPQFEGKYVGLSWTEWRWRIEKLCPIQYWIREELMYDWIYWLQRRPKDWWYEFKCFLSPYNVLKIKTLPRTWMDEDTRLIHAMMAVLAQFMEVSEHHDWESGPERVEAGKILNEIWTWWNARDTREKELQEAYEIARKIKGQPYEIKYALVNKLEAEHLQLEEKMLINLIKIREYLWT